jgi:hypothetical protein
MTTAWRSSKASNPANNRSSCAPRVTPPRCARSKSPTSNESRSRCTSRAARRSSGASVESSGSRLARAEVAWSNGEPLATLYLDTSEEGRFVVDGVPQGRASIAARCARHASNERELEGSEHELELVLEPSPLLRGELHDDLGAPLAGLRVRAQGPPSSSLAPDAEEARSDARGCFELADARAAPLEVRGADWPRWLGVRDEWLVDGARGVSVCVPRDALPSSWLVGELRLADGSLARERTLDLLCPLDASHAVFLPGAGHTSSDGRMRLGPLPAGAYQLFLARGNVDADDALLGSVGRYRLAANEERDVSCTLPPAGELVCELRFDDGLAPSALVASLNCGRGGPGLALWRSADQRVSLLPGHYELHAMGDSFAWLDGTPIEIEAGRCTHLAPSLERSLPVRIALAELPDDVDAGAGLVLARADGRKVGRFELQLDRARTQVLQSFLSPGSYRACVQRRDGRCAVRQIEIGPPLLESIELRFER